jgi:peptidoglycan/xylan/chitin deacetylase (PgdA/CDA1 family)
MSDFLRYLIKATALPLGAFSVLGPRGIYFLTYHKAGGELPLDIDLPVPLLEKQLTVLAESGRVLSYESALALLEAGETPDGNRFVLTFDDGYEDFYTCVFPLLQQLDLPAILFVTTGFVEEGTAYPLAKTPFVARPATWAMLARMHESGLVTLGAHTHTHPWLPDEARERIVEELEQPAKLFQMRLGLEVKHFAYPGAFWDETTEQLIKDYHVSAVIGTGRKATAAGFNPYRIPRQPVRRSDGMLFFQARLRGLLDAEEPLYAAVHRLLGQERW